MTLNVAKTYNSDSQQQLADWLQILIPDSSPEPRGATKHSQGVTSVPWRPLVSGPRARCDRPHDAHTGLRQPRFGATAAQQRLSRFGTVSARLSVKYLGLKSSLSQDNETCKIDTSVRVQISLVEGCEFENLAETIKTYKFDTSRYLVWRSALLGHRKDWLTLYQNNVGYCIIVSSGVISQSCSPIWLQIVCTVTSQYTS